MTIQPAAKDDLPAIAALYLHNHREAYRGLLSEDYLSGLTAEACTEKWAAALSCPKEQLWVAREGDALLGFAAGLPDEELPQTWYLESLHVAEAARGKGVGTALIREAARHHAGDTPVLIRRRTKEVAMLMSKLFPEKKGAPAFAGDRKEG